MVESSWSAPLPSTLFSSPPSSAPFSAPPIRPRLSSPFAGIVPPSLSSPSVSVVRQSRCVGVLPSAVAGVVVRQGIAATVRKLTLAASPPPPPPLRRTSPPVPRTLRLCLAFFFSVRLVLAAPCLPPFRSKWCLAPIVDWLTDPSASPFLSSWFSAGAQRWLPPHPP